MLNTPMKRAQSREAMSLAWSLARTMSRTNGGSPREHFKMALKAAWAEVQHGKGSQTLEQAEASAQEAQELAVREANLSSLAGDAVMALCLCLFGLFEVLLGIEAGVLWMTLVGAGVTAAGFFIGIRGMVVYFNNIRTGGSRW